MEQVSGLITRELENLVNENNPDRILTKREEISALGRGGYRAMLFVASSSPSLNQVIVLVSPYFPWTDTSYDQHTVDRFLHSHLWSLRLLAIPITVIWDF